MNTPPFRIGQKVVALRDSRFGYFKKDKTYNVLDIEICDCGYITICIGKVVKDYSFEICNKCEVIRKRKGEYAFHGASNFAPIEESRTRIQYVAVSESLREKAVEIAAVETN